MAQTGAGALGKGGAMIHVFLISDYQLLLQGVSALLKSYEERFCLAGWATQLDPLQVPWGEPAPDVALLDLDMQTQQLLPWVQHWCAQASPRVLLLSRQDKPSLQDQALLAGARGLFDRHRSAEQLLTALEKVHMGELWLERSTTARLWDILAHSGSHTAPGMSPCGLSERELRVLALVVPHSGEPAKVIARRLNISESTLRNHLTSIYRKCGVSNRAGLLAHVMQSGLLGQYLPS